jgi:cytochrome c oxidase subunit III
MQNGDVYTAPEMAARERELNSLYLVTAILVLVIVTVTFGSLIFAFFWRSQNGYLWEHLRIPSVLWITTAILLASSAVLERARHHLKTDDQTGFFRLVQWTAGLGLLFLIGQLAAWLQVLHSNVVLEQDKHSWFIFLFSGLHAIHIFGGSRRSCLSPLPLA